MSFKDKLNYLKYFNNLDVKINKYYIFYDKTIPKNMEKSLRVFHKLCLIENV